MFYLFSLANDVANVDRFNRISGSFNIIFDNIYSFLLGSGTGMTSRALGSYQYESQIIKIFIEWGLIGSFLFFSWFFKTLRDTSKDNNNLKLSNNYLPLLITIICNFSFIQVLTSAPIVSSIAISILSNKIMNSYIPKKY